MENKWNVEMARLAKDLYDVKNPENTIVDVLYSWIDEYFQGTNYDGSEILSYHKPNQKSIMVKFLKGKLFINVDAFGDVITIKSLDYNRQDVHEDYYGTETLKNAEKQILSSKKLFEILDSFTENALENLKENTLYI